MLAILGCAVLASSSIRAQRSAVITQASGQFRITNSRDGEAVFQAPHLAPGRSVTGTVQLSNSGALAGDLNLAQLDVRDHPGANGGRLSNAVHLDVHDITGGNLVPVFGGRLGSLKSRTLGKIAPGQVRTYRFTASLPDTGAPPGPASGDNAYEGSAMTVRYSWKATAPDPRKGGGGTTPSEVRTPRARFRVVSKRLLKRGWLDVLVSCNRACNATAWARAPRARKTVRFRPRSATLTMPGKTARIRLKLSPRHKRQLRAALKTRRRVSVRVNLRVVPLGWSRAQTYSKKIVVKRPKRARR
jgi:hypothetical protein